jgi:hypothetical protein
MTQQNRRVISNRDPMMITSFDGVVAEIERSLYNLRLLALETDFDDAEQRQNYSDNIDYLKRFYERAERMVLDNAA